jgi:hypothetical protein
LLRGYWQQGTVGMTGDIVVVGIIPPEAQGSQQGCGQQGGGQQGWQHWVACCGRREANRPPPSPGPQQLWKQPLVVAVSKDRTDRISNLRMVVSPGSEGG